MKLIYIVCNLIFSAGKLPSSLIEAARTFLVCLFNVLKLFMVRVSFWLP